MVVCQSYHIITSIVFLTCVRCEYICANDSNTLPSLLINHFLVLISLRSHEIRLSFSDPLPPMLVFYSTPLHHIPATITHPPLQKPIRHSSYHSLLCLPRDHPPLLPPITSSFNRIYHFLLTSQPISSPSCIS